LAQSRHAEKRDRCRYWGVKRTSVGASHIPAEAGLLGFNVSISAFETLPLHNPLAVQVAPTDHILLTLLFPNVLEPLGQEMMRFVAK
jgi:hypothetical protein